MKKLFKKNKENLIFFLLLAAIAFSANYKSLHFYFWHDDFSSFYGPRLDQCIHGWPYSGYCTLFQWLYNILGYHPQPYFIIGNLLFFLSSFFFYLFLVNLTNNKKQSFMTAAILASSYIGAGVFLEAWDPLISYFVMSTLFLSLIIFQKSFQKTVNIKAFLLATILLIISSSIFNFRASTNFAPIISLVLLYSTKIKLSKRLILSFFIFCLFLFFFYYLPRIILHIPLDGFFPKINPFSFFTIQKLIIFFQTISSFLITDLLNTALLSRLFTQNQIINFSTITGFSLSISFLLSLIFSFQRKKTLFTLRLYAFLWILAMFFPYWFRNNFPLNTTHRYIIWMYPGILLVWLSYANKKFWLSISLIIIIFNLLATNIFFQKHLISSQKRQLFYTELHSLLPKLNNNSTVYFDSPENLKSTLNDFFRVGFTPSESSLGAEYQIDYRKLTLFTSSHQLKNNQHLVDPSSFYSFYYTGDRLINTTTQGRMLIQNSPQTYTVKPLSTSTNPLGFIIESFQPVIPTSLAINLTSSSTFPIPTPLNITCPNNNCAMSSLIDSELKETFDFLSMLFPISAAQASNAGERTSPLFTIDENENSYWIANRSMWVEHQPPTLTLSFKQPVNLGGIALLASSPNNRPTNFNIHDHNGKTIDHKVDLSSQFTKIIFYQSRLIDSLTITITGTLGNDTPLINELYPISEEFININLEKSLQIYNSLVSYQITKSNLDSFTTFLHSGLNACLIYKDQEITRFRLFVDNKTHKYQINLPSLEPNEPNLTISCLPQNIKVSITNPSVTISTK